MSIMANNMKSAWKEHSDSLTRIKTQLSEGKSPIRSPARSPTGRKSHSPYGKYRQSTPPYLPRLETPPERDARRNVSKIRGNRYELVPPVRETRKYESRNDDYDSWGEESDDESEADPGHYMPQPYPYPVQSYPYGPPPATFVAAPIPVFYPPPPQRKKNQKRNRQRDENDYDNIRFSPRRMSDPGRSLSRAPLKERYEDVNRSESKGVKKKQNRVHFDHPPQNGFYHGFPVYPYPSYYGGEERKPRKDNKYKYIHPRDTPFSPADAEGDIYSRFKDEPGRLMSYYMKDHPLFAERFVDWLVNQTVDEIIPDLLIDVVKEVGHMPGSGLGVLDEIRNDIIAEELPNIINNIVKTSLNEMVDEHMLYTQSEKDPLESFLTRLLDDAVKETAVSVVRETVKEMAQDYVQDKHHEIIYDDLFNDFMDEIGETVVEDAIIDIIGEDFIRDIVIEEELAEEVPEIAKEVLSHYDNKVMRRELKEVSSHAGDKLMMSFMLDYLMTLMARQGKVWSESELANKYMDNLLTDMLLGRLFEVTTQRRKTLKNSPVRKLHQKAVTDVALDVLLQQLSASLDEDLQDVDEYERDVSDLPGSHSNTPVSINFHH